MDSKLEIIKEQVANSLKKMEIIVTNVEYVTEGTYNFLRIELDKINGIDLDTIVQATDIINPIIDELDLIDESYILDVISKENGGK